MEWNRRIEPNGRAKAVTTQTIEAMTNSVDDAAAMMMMERVRDLERVVDLERQRDLERVRDLERAVDDLKEEMRRIVQQHQHQQKPKKTKKTQSVAAALASLNGEALPSMNLQSFMSFLARWDNAPRGVGWYAEDVVRKTTQAAIVADLVVCGIRYLTEDNRRAPFATVDGALFVFDADNQWTVCAPAHFKRRVVPLAHACVVAQCGKWREKNMGAPRLQMLTGFGGDMGDARSPQTARDPEVVAKHGKMTAKVAAINVSSVGLCACVKKRVADAIS